MGRDGRERRRERLTHVFDRADAAFAGVVIIGFEADGEGAVAIQTLPIVNGKDVFTFTIVASDNADGTGNVMEYPLSVDDPEGITIIEEEYPPTTTHTHPPLLPRQDRREVGARAGAAHGPTTPPCTRRGALV